MTKTYYWQDLPQEIKDDFWAAMNGDEETKDDYINRNNSAKTLGEWEKEVDDYNNNREV